MSFFNQSQPQPYSGSVPSIAMQPLLRNTYAWMTVGLLATAAMVYATLTVPALYNLLGSGPVLIGAIIAELALVMVLSFALPRLSAGAATVMFTVYAVLNGFTLSLIIGSYLYTGQSGALWAAFLTAAGVFGAMTIFGLTTNIDLMRYRSYLLFGLIGLLIALVVNLLLRSSALNFVISAFGVLLFTALAAFDTQRIKRMSEEVAMQGGVDEQTMSKLAIMGALRLYLDFVNLFIYLLRLFGNRR